MRALWVVAGASAGAYATTKARRVAASLTRDGVHDRLSGWFAGARVMAEEAGAARRAKEIQLRSRSARSEGPGQLAAGADLRRAPSPHPTSPAAAALDGPDHSPAHPAPTSASDRKAPT